MNKRLENLKAFFLIYLNVSLDEGNDLSTFKLICIFCANAAVSGKLMAVLMV